VTTHKRNSFHGSPRKGNTYHATRLFVDELCNCGDVHLTEFFLPTDLPEFCTGCTLCFGGRQTDCPNAQYSAPILQAILHADALVLATPHYGACDMSAAMKNLLDHIDFLVLNISPNEEMFGKKAFVITTGAGSGFAAKPIAKYLRHCGVNRVYTYSVRLFTDKWGNMSAARRTRHEKALKLAARRFYHTKRKRPQLSTITYFYITRIIIRRFVGVGSYPCELWKQRGYFKKRPF